MPKISRAGKSRAKATAASPSPLIKQTTTNKDKDKDKDNTNNDNDDATAKQEILSRGQRKRMLKRDQYMKREQMVLSSLKLKKEEDQKGRLDGLDAIKDALTDTIQKSKQQSKQGGSGADADATMQSNEAAKTNKAKKDIAQKELTHLNLVLQHPSFQSNPFATMQEHLRNSFVQQAEQQEIVAKDERIAEAKKVVEKKEARKERIRDAKFEKGRKQRRPRRTSNDTDGRNYPKAKS